MVSPLLKISAEDSPPSLCLVMQLQNRNTGKGQPQDISRILSTHTFKISVVVLDPDGTASKKIEGKYPDPHQREKLDPDPHQVISWIRIRITLQMASHMENEPI